MKTEKTKMDKDYENIFENLPFIAFTLDKSGKIINANKYTENLFRMKSKDYQNVPFSEIAQMSKKDLLRAFLEFRKNLSGKTTKKSIYFVKLKNGEERRIELVGIPLKKAGKVVSVLDVGQDLTERDKSEEKYNSIFENTGTATGIFGEDNVITKCNAAFQKMSGFSKEQIEGKMHWYDFVPKDDMKRMMEYHKQRSKKTGHPPSDYECRFINKSGQEKIVHVRISMFLATKERIVSLFDITELKKYQRKIEESERKLKNIIEHSNEVYYTHDTNHILNYISPQCKKVFGYYPSEMMVKWTKLATDNPINKKGLDLTIKAIRTGKKQNPYILELKKKNGQHFLAEVDESPVKDSSGKVVGISGALRDITDRIETENIIHEQRVLGEKLSVVTEMGRAVEYVLDFLLKLDEIDACGVYVTEKKTGGLNLVSSRGLSKKFIDMSSHYDKNSYNLKIAMKGKTFYTKHEELIKKTGEFTKSEEGLIALGIIPIIHEKILIGVVNIASKKKDFFPSDVRDIVESVASQIGGVIARLEAEEELRKSKTVLESKLIDLEKFSSMSVGRELKMVELKRKISRLEKILNDNGIKF